MLHLVCKPPALISLWVACWNLFSMCIRYRFGLLLSSALNFIVHVFIFLSCVLEKTPYSFLPREKEIHHVSRLCSRFAAQTEVAWRSSSCLLEKTFGFILPSIQAKIGVGFFSVFVGKALAALASREDVLKFSDMFLGLNPLKANLCGFSFLFVGKDISIRFEFIWFASSTP